MALAWLGVVALFGRTSWSDWCAPQWLNGDPMEVFARVRIASEQTWHALFQFNRIERLGAPVAADWSAYPVPDRPVFVLTGLLAHVTGLLAAIHLMGALITGLNAASFFLCARWLRWRWEWAAGLALVFAFCSYNVRWGITLSLGQTFPLPPLVLLCARAARNAPWTGPLRGWRWLAGGIGAWLGLSNPYLAYFAGVVAGGALVLALARRVPRERRGLLLTFLACLVVSFVVANAGYLVPHLRGDTGEALVRSAEDMRVYALDPVDWVVPPADHRSPRLAAWGHSYLASRGAGELFYNYLGVAGLVGLVGLVVRQGRRLLHRRWSRLDPLYGLAWIIVFAVAGGINPWLGTAVGLDVFRVGSRIGVYGTLWALLALGGWIAVRGRSWPRQISVPLALLLTGAALWEQTPDLSDPAVRATKQARWDNMHRLTTELEAALPPGAMVFQLPVLPFPEAGMVGRMHDYKQMLPLLVSHSLHFSYGHLRPSPWLAWANYVGRLPPKEMIPALERAGFSLVWLERQAYADDGAAMAAQLQAAGALAWPLPPSAPQVRIFRLQPTATPELPNLDDPRLREPWDSDSSQPLLLAWQGWYQIETLGPNRWRWAVREATLGCWHDGAPASGTLRFRVQGPADSAVSLRQGERVLWRGPPGTDENAVTVSLGTGLNLLVWRLEGHTFRPGGQDPRELGFMVENLSLSVP
jgi:phosphoglycerol transferase